MNLHPVTQTVLLLAVFMVCTTVCTATASVDALLWLHLGSACITGWAASRILRLMRKAYPRP